MKYDEFKDIFMNVLNKYAPIKEKTIRGNNAPFMNKPLPKAFMERSRLKNNYNKFPTEENHLNYKKQRNYCVNLLKQEKKRYYNNLDIKFLKITKSSGKQSDLFSLINKKIYKRISY